MNFVQKGELLAGRPLWHDPANTVPPASPCLDKNGALARLKPSTSPSFLTRLFQTLIRWIAPFFQISRPNILREKFSSVLRSGASNPSSGPIAFADLWTLYRPFLLEDRDCPKNLKKAFEKMERDEGGIPLLHLKWSDPRLSETEKIKARDLYVQKQVEEILHMGEGEVRLLMLGKERGEEGVKPKLFCLLSKRQEGYTIRLVGTGDQMREVDGGPLALGGKDKVQRELGWDGVPPAALQQGEWLTRLLEGWVEQEGVTPQAFVERSAHLMRYRSEERPLSEWTTSSDRADRLFWNVMRTLSPAPEGNGATGAERKALYKQLKLRVEILALFDLFQNMRDDLQPHTPEFALLVKVFEAVAQKGYLACKKGILAPQDLRWLNGELAVIQEAIRQARRRPISATPTLETIHFTALSLATLAVRERTITDEGDPLPPLGHREEGRIPSFRTIEFPSLTTLPLSLYGAMETKELFLEAFRSLFERAMGANQEERPFGRQELLRLFHEVPYRPFEKGEDASSTYHGLAYEHGRKNESSFWWHFSPEEAREVMRKLNLFSKEWVEQKGPTSISQYEFEAFLQLCEVVNLLNAQVTGKWISNFDVSVYIDELQNRGSWRHRRVRNSEGWKSVRTLRQLALPLSHLESNYCKSVHFGLSGILNGDDGSLYLDQESKRWYEGRVIPLSEEERLYVTTQEKCLQTLLHAKSIVPGMGGSLDLDAHQAFLRLLSWNLWQRPIEDPTLKALYHYATSGVGDDGLQTPEAFHDNPEGIFNLYLERFREEKGKKTQGEETLSLSFTDEEKKRLLRLVRRRVPHVELIAFMHECPSLMQNPQVRNFFDALFFHHSLNCDDQHGPRLREVPDCDHADKVFLQAIPEQIDREIADQTARVEELLRGEGGQGEKLKSRLELLLYYYEMREKIKALFQEVGEACPPSPPLRQALTRWRQLCEERRELRGTLGYAARVHLRALFADHQEGDISEILHDYALIFGHPVDGHNLDPHFEEELHRQWQTVTERTLCTVAADMSPFLDLLCYGKDLPLDESPWGLVAPFIYQNAHYKVNIRMLEVSRLGLEGTWGFLPHAILQNPHFQTIVGRQKAEWRVHLREVGNKKIYSLTDAGESPLQIESEGGQLRFYKPCATLGERWLQILPENPLVPKKKRPSAEIEANPAGLWELFRTFFALRQDLKETPALFAAFAHYPIGIDPADPASLYCLDAQGKALFQLKVSETAQGMRVDEAIDYRTIPATRWELHKASAASNEALKALSVIEKEENIVFWSQQGTLKKMEWPRYGLTFAREQGEWVCLDPPLQGYQLDPAATVQEKKGFLHAVLLRHPDPKKPNKLLVPEAEVLVPKREWLLPTARGFAKIPLFFEEVKDAFDCVWGKPWKCEQRVVQEIDATRKKIPFMTVDLRPITGEIHLDPTEGEEQLLLLIRHALKSDQPTLAGELLQKVRFTRDAMNSSFFKRWLTFIRKPLASEGATGAEAALKIKLSFQLIDLLKMEGKWSRPWQGEFQKSLLKLGKTVWSHGRRLPDPLQLTEAEKKQLLCLFRKGDPDYYNRHLKVYLTDEGTRFDPFRPLEGDFKPLLAAWKAQRPAVKLEARIGDLEARLSPSTRLNDEELAYRLPRLERGASLLTVTDSDLELLFEPRATQIPDLDFTPFASTISCEQQALSDYQGAFDRFKAESEATKRHRLVASKATWKRWVQEKLLPQKVAHAERAAALLQVIEEQMHRSENPEEQLAMYAAQHPLASFEELRRALASQSLESLLEKGRLPSSINLDWLREQLVHYFDALVRQRAAEVAIALAEEIAARGESQREEEWASMSEELYRLLTLKRNYDPYREPRLLIFEAQQFLHFKTLDGGVDQLSLLESLLQNSHEVIQAPTGAGKTAILSVMRSLLKANGKNLVIQQVLPSLYRQTHEHFNTVLDLYGSSLYPLRFDLKRKMSEEGVERYRNAAGVWEEKKVQRSIFKGMYYDLLSVIENKGCVLTDYKSLPLLEELFWKIGNELVETEMAGDPFPPLLEEHYAYLRKILILLENKSDVNMDEFDQPNRPTQKIQLDMGLGAHPLPEWLITEAMALYDFLADKRALGLLKNIQGDLAEEARLRILTESATEMAAKLAGEAGDPGLQPALQEYLLGRNEEILPRLRSMPPAYRDRVALFKDQFSIYLPLTLRGKEGSRYKRSQNGAQTLPCHKGERHEATPGTMLEQVNYAIQDYLQAGITAYDFKSWLKQVALKLEEAPSEEQRERAMESFRAILPGKTLEATTRLFKTPEGAASLLAEINRDPGRVRLFLLTRLREMKTSGARISMGPQDIVAMSRAVSGISATMGAPDSLHRQFQVDEERNSQIQAQMLSRLLKRAAGKEVLTYDPEHPEEMLAGEYHALMDGAGAFKEAKQGAEMLLASHGALQQVGYHREDEAVAWVGSPTGDPAKKGFVFAQARTRGTDIALPPDAKALLTLDDKDGIREFFQIEGRLRLERQRYRLTVPLYQEIASLTEAVAHAIKQEGSRDAQEIFRKCKQEPESLLRSSMRKRLLEAESAAQFVALFSQDAWRSPFITPPEPHFEEEGSYFEARCRIQRNDMPPGQVLPAHKQTFIQKARAWGLDDAVTQLEEIAYPESRLAKMPPGVPPVGSMQGELEMELQVEQQEEREEERELALETETESVKRATRPLGSYPRRIPNTTHSWHRHHQLHTTAQPFHQVSARLHSAYSEQLHMTEAFLPFSRMETRTLHRRHPFDETMYRIGEVYFKVDPMSGTVTQALIEDPLRDSSIVAQTDFCYDIRTDRVVFPSSRVPDPSQLPSFAFLVAQIKFLDGRHSGYSAEQLQALAGWLRQTDLSEMKRHFLGDILRHRHEEKETFWGSQLDTLFQQLTG